MFIYECFNEKEVIKNAIKKFPFSKIEKFIQKSFGELIGKAGWKEDLVYGQIL